MTERASRSSSQRPAPSTKPTVPSTVAKPPCQIHPTAILSDKAVLSGINPISIEENTVIHPYAKIDSTNAPVSIGRNCIIAERTIVGVQGEDGSQNMVQLADHVTIETGARVEASIVGRGSVIDVNAIVGAGSTIGQFCKIAAGCTVQAGETVPDFTIIYGLNERRTDRTTRDRADVRDLKLKGQTMHIDTLRKLIPSNIAKWQT